MKSREDKLSRQRLRTSYFTTVVSITLVLFMLGIMGILVLNAHKVSNYVRENIGFSIIFKDAIKDADIMRIQKNIDSYSFVKSSKHISKALAQKELQKDLGEDFVDFLGYNPLPVSIEIKLNANYANIDSLRQIEKKLKVYPQIKEIWYQKSLVHMMNENIKKISLIILSFSALLLLISIVLINNTIRLSVHSKRLIINTMTLVGATRYFIRKPFLRTSILHGIYSGLIAISGILTSLYFVQKEVPEITIFHDVKILIILSLTLISIGIIISYLSTLFSVNKYLKINPNKIY